MATWAGPAELTTSPFIRWYHPTCQFDYSTIRGRRAQPSVNFFTANVSVKRVLLVDCEEYFDEDFRAAAFEDLEPGERLEKRGLELTFDPSAVGHHHHPVSVSSAIARMKTCGRNAELYSLKTGRQQVLSVSRRLEHLTRCAVLSILGWPTRWLANLLPHRRQAPRLYRWAL